MPGRTGILLVCLGNICRSPTAEGVLRALLDEAGVGDRFQVDSAGTLDTIEPRPPHPRAQEVARERGIALAHLRARRVMYADFDRFDHIIALDRQVLAALRSMAPDRSRARLALLLDWVPGCRIRDVPDPYLGEAGFDEVYQIIDRACRGLLRTLIER